MYFIFSALVNFKSNLNDQPTKNIIDENCYGKFLFDLVCRFEFKIYILQHEKINIGCFYLAPD